MRLAPLLPFEGPLTLEDKLPRHRCVLPSFCLYTFAFQVLVDREEVRDLTQDMGVNLGIIPNIFVSRITLAHRQKFLIVNTLIEHVEHTDGTNFHDAAGKARAIDQHEHVERIAVVAERTRQESVIAGEVHWRIQIAVETEDVQLLVVLILVDRLQRDFHYNVHNFRSLLAERQLKIIEHPPSLSRTTQSSAHAPCSPANQAF